MRAIVWGKYRLHMFARCSFKYTVTDSTHNVALWEYFRISNCATRIILHTQFEEKSRKSHGGPPRCPRRPTNRSAILRHLESFEYRDPSPDPALQLARPRARDISQIPVLERPQSTVWMLRGQFPPHPSRRFLLALLLPGFRRCDFWFDRLKVQLLADEDVKICKVRHESLLNKNLLRFKYL